MKTPPDKPNSALPAPHRAGRVCVVRAAGATAGSTSSGFSLVELMIALLIGLIIMAAVVQIFSASRATYQLDEGLARLQENGRFAMEFITRDLRNSAMAGCKRKGFDDEEGFYNNLDNSGGVADWSNFAGISGSEYIGTGFGNTPFALTATSNATGGWSPAFDSLLVLGSDTGGPGALPGSDVLIVRQLSGVPMGLQNPPHDNTTVFLDPAFANRVKKGQIVAITDCKRTSVFQVTDVAGAGTELAHAAGAGDPGNACGTWDTDTACKMGQSLGPSAELQTFETFAYYVAMGTSGRPALYRAYLEVDTGDGESFPRGEELVEGVENMQIVYGVDTNTGSTLDGRADAFMTADQVETAGLWPRVVSIQISLLVASRNVSGTATDVTSRDENTYVMGGDLMSANRITVDPTDDFARRRVFTSTIVLRNRGV
ncbi:MAG TPA: PilW family protein [Acidiferrobacterales bacterium]